MPKDGRANERKTASEPTRPVSRDESAFIEAAWLYYHEGLNQNEIAARLCISRASVVNYLNEVRSRGWVKLYLDRDVFRRHEYAAQLRDIYGLSDVLVVPDDAAEPGAELSRVTRAAADWLPSLLSPGDRLGVSWGQTVYQMARQMTVNPIDNLRVVQLLGSCPARPDFAAEDCTSIIAQKLNGLPVNLHVPLLFSSREVRDIVSQEPDIAAQIDELATCNKCVLACGVCDVDAHVVNTGIIDADDIAKYREKGAVGVICGRLIDANGHPVYAAVEDRMIGVTLEGMLDKEMALLIVAGEGRAASARAAIRGGYVTHLAISTRIAAELLKDVE